jgi:hypothetical protein
VILSPVVGDLTKVGLPTRVPGANLVPGSISGKAAAEAPARSADEIRNRMSSFQRGVREGRAAVEPIEVAQPQRGLPLPDMPDEADPRQLSVLGKLLMPRKKGRGD